MTGWLLFVGKRRPESVADQAAYKEPDTKDRASSPSQQQVPKGVEGHPLGGRKQK
jgi:hypothetical protein